MVGLSLKSVVKRYGAIEIVKGVDIEGRVATVVEIGEQRAPSM